ncbi:MAG: XTP/dITP diphosphatase [Clostridia bacterium]|nr:XTP/dITP diphosphatase [Clostridia bacterium]
MKIVLASRNKKKIAEVLTLLKEQGGMLADIDVLSLDDIGMTDEIEETGKTFRENALIKASVPASLGYIGVADDSGLAVDALGGAPGVYSARYAGEPCDDEKNNQKLLAELENTPDNERTAQYVCAIACVFPDGRQFTVEGSCKGLLLREYHGDGGFGYDPLFYYPGYQRTFAEISGDMKNRVSHRGKAMKDFCKKLSEYITPPVTLNSKSRAYLRSLSNNMQPIFQIGKGGISGEIYKQLSNALEARELIKITVLETCYVSAREAADMISDVIGAAVVAVTGRKIVLYRESQENKKIFLP